MTTHAMSKQLEQSGDLDPQAQQKKVTKSGRKRGIVEAFPGYYGCGTKVISNIANSATV